MPPHLSLLAKTAIALLAAVIWLGDARMASAGGQHDQVSADAFGNLIIRGASGYKQIVVGEGHMARQLADYLAAGDQPDGDVEPAMACYSPPSRWQGRSRMYGLAEGIVPTPPVYCD